MMKNGTIYLMFHKVAFEVVSKRKYFEFEFGILLWVVLGKKLGFKESQKNQYFLISLVAFSLPSKKKIDIVQNAIIVRLVGVL